MSKENRPRSWREMRDHRASQKSFIGREAQLKEFRDVLTKPYDQRNKVIFSISGQGGIGKTTLLKQFRRIAEDLKQLTAFVDEGAPISRVDDVPEALDRLAIDFEKQGHKFDKFRDRYKIYRQKRQELEADPEAPQGLAAGLGRTLTKASLVLAKSIPGSGAVLGLVEEDAVGDKAGEWMAYIVRKFTNKDEVRLLREPVEVLSPLFLEDINRIAEKQTVVLLLDTYEQTGSFLDDWLRSLLSDRHGELTPDFLIGIAGRDSLSRNIWSDMEDWIVRSELEPFTEDEARQYLIDREITNEAVIQEIWQLSSGGLPLLIGMMAQAVPTSAKVVLDPCEVAVERFLKWELDGTKRQLALNAALPRMLNRDVLALLIDQTAVNDLFEWLKGRSFVVEHPEGWQYHNIVREQMLRYQRRISPKEWTTEHTKLAEYYEGLRNRLELTDEQQQKNEFWQKFTLEWLYHCLCAAPLQQMGMALSGWLMGLDNSEKFAQQWTEAMNMAGIATGYEDVKRWSEQLQNGLRGLEEKRSNEMVEVLSKLLQEAQLEDKYRAIALAGRGIFPLSSNLQKNSSSLERAAENTLGLDQTIEDLTKAVSLAPDKGEYFAWRCLAYMKKRDTEKARSDLNRALELDKDLYPLKEEMESTLSKLEELQMQNEELHNLEGLMLSLKEKVAMREELEQGLRRLMEEICGQGEEFQSLRGKELAQRLVELLEIETEKLKKLAEELQKKKAEPQSTEEEIQELMKGILKKKKELHEVVQEAERLLKEHQEIKV